MGAHVAGVADAAPELLAGPEQFQAGLAALAERLRAHGTRLRDDAALAEERAAQRRLMERLAAEGEQLRAQLAELTARYNEARARLAAADAARQQVA